MCDIVFGNIIIGIYLLFQVEIKPAVVPQELEDFHDSEKPEFRRFKDTIRTLNGALSLAAMGAIGNNLIKTNQHHKISGYDPNVRYQGRIYHSLGPLVPDPGEQKKYAQFFIGSMLASCQFSCF